ncbi:MAG TPA: hypothetical protein VMB47_14775 [Candidatus Aquilonibacter sp.]|nr:hypothetical protein [Candidatus Aquilonibacter sp.]
MSLLKGSWGSSSRRSVSDDWISALPREKSEAFDIIVANWESLYAMMSVSLDDSLSLRARGELVCARQQVAMTADLFERVSASLISFCDAAVRHSRHLRSFPSVHPLNTDFFRGNIGQNAASWNGILHRVLFSDSSRFRHKVRILSDTLRRLDVEFHRAAKAISRESHPAETWDILDCVHYDLNTCLRENEVLLKSFLRALPAQHLGPFAGEMGVPLPSAGFSSQTRLFGASA